MRTPDSQFNEQAVLGQKFAFASASLLLGIASYISLLGLEKGILAVIFGILALKARPLPSLDRRRAWGKVGIALGAFHLALVLVVLVAGWRIVLALMLFAADIGGAMLHGPKTVLSVPSPDGEFVAYVEDLPSIDPPNQAMFVEKKDQRHFMSAGGLAEDVDSIQRIVWSPDSRIVVFHSRDYLTAMRVTDWRTVRVFLGKEWTRSRASRRSTFTSGGEGQVVDVIEFGEPDSFSYRIKGQGARSTVRFGDVSERAR
jgi:hypothetical protein